MDTHNITKTDQYMLAHLMPLAYFTMPGYGITYYTDTYLCYVGKYQKRNYIWSINEKVQKWVERNGGTYQKLSDMDCILGEKKGLPVRITFPTYTKRDMKNIMATLFCR